jgi:MFS family permease
MAFAYNPFISVAFLLLVVSGAGTIIVVTSCNMLLQHLVPDNLRGRVMALYTMSFIGMMPIGSLITGTLAQVIGVEPIFAASGIAALAIGYALTRKLPDLREQARSLLAQKGLLP